MMNLLEDNQKQQRSTILPFCSGCYSVAPDWAACNIYACIFAGYVGALGCSNTPHLHRNLLLPCFIERKAT